MPRPDINQVRNLTDFSTVYNWNLNVINFPTVVPSPTPEDVNLRCISTTLPTTTNNAQAISIRGHKVYQPGVMDYNGTITLTMAEHIDSLINQWILDWREKCWETETGIAYPKLETDATIKIVRLDRLDQPIWEYLLIGCWLQNYTQPDLIAENGLWQPTITLQFDYFKDGVSV